MDKKRHNEGMESLRQLADQINDGFADIMEKTNSQMEEITDPLEAKVKQREIFQKNLKSYKASEQSCSSSGDDDNDSGVGESGIDSVQRNDSRIVNGIL